MSPKHYDTTATCVTPPVSRRPTYTPRSTSRPDAREEIRVGQLAIRFLLDGEESGGSAAAFEFDVPAGAQVAAGHSHDGYEETIYGLEGVLTWTIEGTPTDIGPGEALCIPRGAVHQFDNTHAVDAKALAIVTPGSSPPTTSARSRRSSTAPPAGRPTTPRWARSCTDTESPAPPEPAPPNLSRKDRSCW